MHHHHHNNNNQPHSPPTTATEHDSSKRISFKINSSSNVNDTTSLTHDQELQHLSPKADHDSLASRSLSSGSSQKQRRIGKSFKKASIKFKELSRKSVRSGNSTQNSFQEENDSKFNFLSDLESFFCIATKNNVLGQIFILNFEKRCIKPRRRY